MRAGSRRLADPLERDPEVLIRESLATERAARYLFRVTPRRSNPAESALSARVLPLADRAQRVASMLDRWEAEPVDDEPAWDVEELERIALRKPSP